MPKILQRIFVCELSKAFDEKLVFESTSSDRVVFTKIKDHNYGFLYGRVTF